MSHWTRTLALDSARQVIAGSESVLADAIRRGADLRIYTEFRHNEHIDISSPSDELVREVAEFAVTYLIDDRWTAGLDAACAGDMQKLEAKLLGADKEQV